MNDMRHCGPCDLTWRGNVPCWFCGGQGVSLKWRPVNGPDGVWPNTEVSR